MRTPALGSLERIDPTTKLPWLSPPRGVLWEWDGICHHRNDNLTRGRWLPEKNARLTVGSISRILRRGASVFNLAVRLRIQNAHCLFRCQCESLASKRNTIANEDGSSGIDASLRIRNDGHGTPVPRPYRTRNRSLIDCYDDLLLPGHRWLAQIAVGASGEQFDDASGGLRRSIRHGLSTGLVGSDLWYILVNFSRKNL